MLLGIRARAVVQDGTRREIACRNVLTSFDFGSIADAVVIAVLATFQGHHLGTYFKLDAVAKVVVVGIEFGQHLAAGRGERHGSTIVTGTIITKVQKAKTVARGVLEF